MSANSPTMPHNAPARHAIPTDAPNASNASWLDTLRHIGTLCALDDASPYGMPYAPADYRDAWTRYATDHD